MTRVARSPSPAGRRSGSSTRASKIDRTTRSRALVLGRHPGAEVHPLEHERAKRKHRLTDLVALGHRPSRLGRLDEIVDERVDALRARRAEKLDLGRRQVALREKPVAERVVDVVVDVRDPVDDPHDPPLLGLGLPLAGVRQDPVADLVREVELPSDPVRLLVVTEVPAEALAQHPVERVLPGMTERRVTGVVPEADRLDEVLVQPQSASHDA